MPKNKLKNKFFVLLRLGAQRFKSFFILAGDRTLIALWAGCISLIILLLFMLSAGFRVKLMGEKINAVLNGSGGGKILIAPVSPWRMNGEAMSFGTWWIIGREGGVDKTENYGVAFNVIQGGVLAPFFGIALENGAVELLPLTQSAKIINKRITPGMLDVYRRRVLDAAKKIEERKSVIASKKL